MKSFPVQFGCDPEFFFKKDGKVIGSEKVLSKNGLEHLTSVVKDGIQAEIHPQANECRVILANNLSNCLASIAGNLEGVECDFSPLVDIDKEEMDSLSDDSKQFGCSPSISASDKKATIKVKDPSKYLFRSAGGHIHLGITNEIELLQVHKNIDTIVKLMDIIVGNTCVLLDRHEGNVERRKNYGRAGEYRIKPYGFEYRTLSNFWLRHYQLMSLSFGLARYALNVWRNNEEQQFFDLVDYEVVKHAINNNDFELAKEIFDKIKVLFPANNLEERQGYMKGRDTNYYMFPLTQENLGNFETFVSKGIDHYYKDNVLEHWVSCPASNNVKGWDQFITNLE